MEDNVPSMIIGADQINIQHDDDDEEEEEGEDEVEKEIAGQINSFFSDCDTEDDHGADSDDDGNDDDDNNQASVYDDENNNNNNPTPASNHHNYQNKLIYRQQQYSTPTLNQVQPPKLHSNEQTITYEFHHQQRYIPGAFIQNNNEDDELQPREIIQLHPTPQTEQHHLNNMNSLSIANNEEIDDYGNPIIHVGLNQYQQQMQTPKNPTNYIINSNGIEMNGHNGATNIEDYNFDDLNINQVELQDSDVLKREYGNLRILYIARGKKLDEVSNRFEAFKEDVTRQTRSLTHQANMANKDKEEALLSLEQSHQLAQTYQSEIETLTRKNQDMKQYLDQSKITNDELNAKLKDTTDEIESLNFQLQQLQKLDSIERMRAQNDQILNKMREKYESDAFLMKEKMNRNDFDLSEKIQAYEILKIEYDKFRKDSDSTLLERNDMISRLKKQNSDMLVSSSYNDSVNITLKLNEKIRFLEDGIRERDKQLERLQTHVNELEEQVKLNDAMNANDSSTKCNNNSNLMSTSTSNDTLRKEVRGLMDTLKTKRSDIEKYQKEIQRLKDELNSYQQQQQPKSNSEAHEAVEEFTKQVVELESEIVDLKCKLEDSYRETDSLNEKKQCLENEIDYKNQQIESLNFEIGKYEQQSNVDYIRETLKVEFENEKFSLVNDYEQEIQSLKLELGKLNSEMDRTKEAYIEVCTERKGVEERLRSQYESNFSKVMAENESKMKSVNDERERLYEKDKNETEKNNQIKVAALEKEIQDLKNDRKKLETNYKAEIEGLLKEKSSLLEKCSNLEKENVKNNEIETLRQKLKSSDVQIENYKKEASNFTQQQGRLERQNAKYADEIDQLNRKYLSEIDDLKQKIGECEKRFEELNKRSIEEKTVINSKIESLERDLKTKLEQIESLKNEKDSLDAKYKQDYERLKNQTEEKNKKYSKELEAKLNEELSKLTNLKQNLENAFKKKELDLNAKLEKSDQLEQQFNDLKALYENSKLAFEQEKSAALAQKEEEHRKSKDGLEKSFDENYSKFIKSYKENLAKTLQEKSDEFSREKDALNNLYEKKINELEAKEQNLLKQIKDMKKSLSVYSTPEIQPTQRTASETIENLQETSTCERLHLTNLQSSSRSTTVNALVNRDQEVNNEINRLKIENESLTKQIKKFEELVSNADSHFEAEIEKLRNELEHELEQKEIEHQLLLNQLNSQNEQNLQNELETMRKQILLSKTNENSDDTKFNIYKQQQQDKFIKLKQELNLRDKQVEQLEIQLKNKVEKIKFDYDKALNAEKESWEKIRRELDEQYKIQTQRIRQENENLQNIIQKLKKTNSDSDKVIQNLKDELNKIQSNNLDEMKSLKLNLEREKDILQQQIDHLNSKLLKAEKSNLENDDKIKNELEAMRAKLKEQYGQELTKMNAKMKDMMKSHSVAIELLKKQHTAEKAKHGIEERYKPMTFSTTCQTDVHFGDIKLLETFKMKYAEMTCNMKKDMLRQYDEQTLRLSDQLRRGIEEERIKIGEQVQKILFKKLGELLSDYRVSELTIDSIVHELEQELKHILAEKTSPSIVTTVNDHDSSSNDLIGKLNNFRISSPRSTASSNGSVENKRFNNSQLIQKQMDHDSLSVHSADVQMISKHRQFSANLRKANETAGKSSQNNTKDLHPFYSSSMSSFQNHDTKSDSGNGSSCYDTSSKHRMTPTFKNSSNEAQMTTSTTSTNSSSNSKQLSYEEQPNTIASPKSATRNYKYTPLRQSWGNLNQITQLSTFSSNQINDSEINDSVVSCSGDSNLIKSSSSTNIHKERPTSASNVLLRTNMMLASLNDNKSSVKRAENNIYNILNNNNEPTSNTLRSFSVTNGFDKDATIIDTTPNRYGSLPRSTNSQNNQQPNVKLLTIPSKSRPFSAGHNSSSSSNIGLSIFKESSTNVQTIESKSTKTGATISMNNNNYNYAIESDYNDQFVDDNLPEMDCSSSTVSSSVSAALYNSKPTTVTSNSSSNNMIDTYQKLRTSVHSASYRPPTATTTNQPTISNPKKSSTTTATTTNSNKINADLISSSTSSLFNNKSSQSSINNNVNNNNTSNITSRNPQVLAPSRKK